jgi:hypothetical protein
MRHELGTIEAPARQESLLEAELPDTQEGGMFTQVQAQVRKLRPNWKSDGGEGLEGLADLDHGVETGCLIFE